MPDLVTEGQRDRASFTRAEVIQMLRDADVYQTIADQIAAAPKGFVAVPRNTNWVQTAGGTALDGTATFSISAFNSQVIRGNFGVPSEAAKALGIWAHVQMASTTSTICVTYFDSSDVTTPGQPGSVSISATNTVRARGVFPIPLGADGAFRINVTGANIQTFGIFVIGYYN